MPRPTSRTGTANRLYRRRIPADVLRILDGLPESYRPQGWGKTEITITLGTSDGRRSAAEHARVADGIERHMQGLRAGVRCLGRKQAVALAGVLYAGFTEAGWDAPEHAALWQRVLDLNEDARRGRISPLFRYAHGDAMDTMEARFGKMVDIFLGSEALILDQEGRHMLFQEISRALDDAATRMIRETRGDYSPDPVAERFPSWLEQRPEAPKERLALRELFDRWAEHPEQAQTARRTKARYKGVLAAAAAYLGDPDAHAVTQEQLRDYLDARMAADGPERLLPRVARDVHRAALSSVYRWALDKRIVAANPAAGIRIKVKKPKKLRPKEATDHEVRELVAAILPGPADGAAGSFAAAVRWCLLIALWTGCRIGEACQLRKADILGGPFPMISITPEAGDVKDGEQRQVPIHPRLVELGFLSFTSSAPSGPLFYDPARRRDANAATPQAELLAAELVAWGRGHGLGDPLLVRPLHALRHRFMSLARTAGIEKQYAAAIAGHEPGSVNEAYGSFPPAVLHREINKLSPSLVEGGVHG